MKVCKFCGSENSDSRARCSSCGANEFKYKCPNCSTVYEEGNYCPTCGIKAGAKQKQCPNCGTSYYSVACPDCGYTKSGNNNTTIAFISTSSKSSRKKDSNTWLWVLGWLFMFPVPLTILMVRNQSLDKRIRIGVIAVAWVIYLIIGLVGGSGNNAEPQTDPTGSVPTEAISQS